MLALDMLRAGYAKAYVPDAAVIHSHEYRVEWLRRSFDEARALQEIYGFSSRSDIGASRSALWGQVGADWRWVARAPRPALGAPG